MPPRIVPYDKVIVRSRRRTLSLQVQMDGSLVIRAPHSLNETIIDKFLNDKRDWIERASQKIQLRYKKVRSRNFVEGETFLYLGQEYPLHVAEDMFGQFLFEDRFIIDARYQAKAARLMKKWYQEEAFRMFTQRCQQYAGQMGVRYRSLSLSSAKSRWGCCTPHGTLRFCWRLIMAPLDIIDYVAVHELAHLKELNHSTSFWRLVGQVLPDYRQRKDWLNENGVLLNWP